MMYCSKCGALNSEKGNFCGKCGASLKESAGQPLRSRERTSPAVSEQTSPAQVRPESTREVASSPPLGPAAQENPVRRPPPVTRPYFAGFWKRFGAYMIDEIILSVIGIMMLVVIAAMIGVPMELTGVDEDIIAPLIVLYLMGIEFLLNWLYFTVLESSGRQATLGKMAMGIVVTDMNGRRISFGRANGRFWSKIISGLFFNVGYIIAGFTERKQALHDLIAASLVINS